MRKTCLYSHIPQLSLNTDSIQHSQDAIGDFSQKHDSDLMNGFDVELIDEEQS